MMNGAFLIDILRDAKLTGINSYSDNGQYNNLINKIAILSEKVSSVYSKILSSTDKINKSNMRAKAINEAISHIRTQYDNNGFYSSSGDGKFGDIVREIHNGVDVIVRAGDHRNNGFSGLINALKVDLDITNSVTQAMYFKVQFESGVLSKYFNVITNAINGIRKANVSIANNLR